jgi:hypothetical protein
VRRIVPVIAAFAVLLGVRAAWASCGACCSNTAELLGWSKDGRTYAVKEQIGTSPQIVVLRDGKELERWGGDADDACLFERAKPAMPADTFAKHKIEPFSAAWHDAFKAGYRTVPARKPVLVAKAKCTGTDLVVNGDGRIVASFVAHCDPNETDCIRGTVNGGHAHPTAPYLLVKQTVHSCGYTSTTRFRLVRR